MLRLLGRAIALFGAYFAVLLAVVIAGFLGNRIGIWAAVLWLLLAAAAVFLFLRRRQARAP